METEIEEAYWRCQILITALELACERLAKQTSDQHAPPSPNMLFIDYIAEAIERTILGGKRYTPLAPLSDNPDSESVEVVGVCRS